MSLDYNRAWHIKSKLDIDLLRSGAKILEGRHDFSTFRSSSCSAKSPVKDMISVNVKKEEMKYLLLLNQNHSYKVKLCQWWEV